MKIGDLVQRNIFLKSGSGPYGLIVGDYPTPGYWNVKWTTADWDLSYQLAAMYEVHERDLVVVSES